MARRNHTPVSAIQLRNRYGAPLARRLAAFAATPEPRARSAVFGVDEDDAGLVKRALNVFDGLGLVTSPRSKRSTV
jgi:hypothetical protein